LFDERSYELFKEILNYKQITTSEVIRKLSLSERQFNYDLEKVNDALDSLKMPQIKIENSLFIVDEKLKGLTKSELLLDNTLNSFIISEQARIYLLYLYTFIRKEPISNYHYQVLLDVSKNTALTDVKKVRKLCLEWNVELIYSRIDGYHLKGLELDKRRLASYCIGTLLSQPLGRETIILAMRKWQSDDYLVSTQQIIEDFIQENAISLVKNRKKEIILQLSFVRARNKSGHLLFKTYETQIIEEQSLYDSGRRLSEKLFPETSRIEQYYVTIQLLIAQQEVSHEENASLSALAERIIEEFERITLLPIDDKVFLKKNLYNHLVPAFFRIAYGIPLVNPLITRIKKEYRDLFQFVQRALQPLSMWTGQQLSEDEIGFFTILFGGYLRKEKRPKYERLNALIACTNGISSSIMLRAQLSEMYPQINLSSVHSVEEISTMPIESYDLVFSTVEVVSIKPVYVVKPLLSQVEKNYLFQAVAADFPELNGRNITVDHLIEVIGKYADIKNEKKLFSELVNILYLQNTDKGRYAPMLSELLTEDMIHFTEEKLEWKDAITKTAQPLLHDNRIEQSYIDAMIGNVEELGPYIHIGKGIAIPHARPETGVKGLGMSLLRTKTPVLLLGEQEHQIDVFICLAAIDNEAHLKALAHLTKILADDKKLQLIKDADTSEQIIEIIS
jgi:PTS system ascorbate-specific IIA component